ncbi:hypothetical protein D6856_10700 [Butyrivibrio sp. XB500-5]|uniref:hypothetical protein n=1 Tax=Butyrivibrio sp. XB500-5 TaxID=2364880 RepID=UPI000EAA38CF|nr:hypothetical protein [Butyrivibrio sp. XB500-5]RKM59673.1 hypothetical protein D6856_10700 [Butyrivibrio sp. XB500-5]
MDRNKNKYMEETLDLKSFYLRLIKKLWLIPVMALIGALIGGCIYYLVTVIFGPERCFEAQTSFYLTYSPDAYLTNESGGTMIDYYNSYSWSKLILPSHDVLEETAKILKDEGCDITEEEVKNSVSADVPSDYRFLVITVKNADKDKVNKITDAIIKDFEIFPSISVMHAVDTISVISRSDVYPEKVDNRILTAFIFGAVVAALLAVLIILLLDAFDDSVYVPEECERRYGIPVLGVLSSKGEICDMLKNELTAAYEKYASKAEKAYFISTDSLEDYERSVKDLDVLKNVLGNGRSESVSKLTPMEVPGKVLENYRKIGESDGVILGVPMGKKNGCMTEHVISQLKKHDCPILGIVIARADEKFIKKYYGV